MSLVLESFLVVSMVECVTSRPGSAACPVVANSKGSKFKCLLFVASRVTEADVVEAKVGMLSGQM